MTSPVRSAHILWVAGALVLALLAWQWRHVAVWLPQLERGIADLGPWGPLALIFAILLLGPLLVPDSIFGVAAGACFGLFAGMAYYFAGVYLMCLFVQLASHRWLRTPVLRQLERRARLRAAVTAAFRGGVRFTFLVRLVPVNQALLSYAFGAAGVPFRFALIGNVGMFAHLFSTVYFGAAAAHLTRMAGGGYREWQLQSALLLLGLGVCAFLTVQVTRRAWAAIDAVEPMIEGSRPDARRPC
jgi:uncharacterized membrane protein YdjX (TVP38/TMEM64 family)